jgi:2-oxo-4-hydroxy-4-carboxy-5-ureidoimidazoline decarboxylase
VPLTLAAINALDEETFTTALGFVFELSPWVVTRAHAAAPFASREALHAAMTAVLNGASEADRLALIRAHPELAGKAAIAKQLTSQEFARFHELNAAYGAKFGFPFIICARLNDKTSILDAMSRRLAHDRSSEVDEAIAQIGLISRLRLFDAVTP